MQRMIHHESSYYLQDLGVLTNYIFHNSYIMYVRKNNETMWQLTTLFYCIQLREDDA